MSAKNKALTTKQITLIAAILTAVATIIAALITAWATKPQGNGPNTLPTKISSKIELVDVSPTPGADGTYTIDVKLRNTGDAVAIVKQAIFHVRNFRHVDTCGGVGSALPVSSTYQVTFPHEPQTPQFDVSTDLSQSIKPNEADRFQFQVGLDTENPSGTFMAQFQLELLFNAGTAETVVSEPLLIALPTDDLPDARQASPEEFAAYMPDAESKKLTIADVKKCINDNLQDELFMLNLSGRRSSALQQALPRVKLKSLLH